VSIVGVPDKVVYVSMQRTWVVPRDLSSQMG